MQKHKNELYNYPKRHLQTGSLYKAEDEHDACGIGIVAELKRMASHRVIIDALSVLRNLEHRGAENRRRGWHSLSNT